MSESKSPDPVPHGQDPASIPAGQSDDYPQSDPLLGPGSFIDPNRNDCWVDMPECQNHEPKLDVDCETDPVIDAKPVSNLAPGGNWVQEVCKLTKNRNFEEIAKRPDWLPDDWEIELKVRCSGATAGTIDRYYVAPSSQRKLRSKTEVLRFLESRGTPKQKPKSDADAESPSVGSGSRKKTKSSMKRKKPESVVV